MIRKSKISDGSSGDQLTLCLDRAPVAAGKIAAAVAEIDEVLGVSSPFNSGSGKQPPLNNAALPPSGDGPGGRWYSIKEVCKWLGIGKTLYHDLVKKGLLKAHKIGRRTLIAERDLLDFARRLSEQDIFTDPKELKPC